MPQDRRVVGLASVSGARRLEVELSCVASDWVGTKISRCLFVLAVLGLNDRKKEVANVSY